MDTKKPRHSLSNVDLESQTATCAVCGDVQIYVYKDPKRSKTDVHCLNKQNELKQAIRERTWEKRLQDPNWKPRHQLSEIDAETMTARCTVCGLTVIHKHGQDKGRVVYSCATKKRADSQRRWRRHHGPQPLRQSSEIRAQNAADQKQIIDNYKLECGCKSCGYNADPQELELHFSDVDEAEFTIAKLVLLRRKRLRHALRISEVYCVRCHPVVHSNTAQLEL